MMNRIKQFFITTLVGGLVVLLPLVIIIWLITFLIRFITGLLKPIADIVGNFTQYHVVVLDIIAYAIAILLCFVVGLFVRTRIGRTTFGSFEDKYLIKLPLYGTIKETVQQFSGAKKMPFSDVVLFHMGKYQMTGFITEEHENGQLTIFVPTAPNPTNGFIFHVAESDIERVEVSSEEAMRSIIGIGVGSGKLLDRSKMPVKKDPT